MGGPAQRASAPRSTGRGATALQGLVPGAAERGSGQPSRSQVFLLPYATCHLALLSFMVERGKMTVNFASC